MSDLTIEQHLAFSNVFVSQNLQTLQVNVKMSDFDAVTVFLSPVPLRLD